MQQCIVTSRFRTLRRFCPSFADLRMRRQHSSESMSSINSAASHSSMGSMGKDAEDKKKKKKSWVGEKRVVIERQKGPKKVTRKDCQQEQRSKISGSTAFLYKIIYILHLVF